MALRELLSTCGTALRVDDLIDGDIVALLRSNGRVVVGLSRNGNIGAAQQGHQAYKPADGSIRLLGHSWQLFNKDMDPGNVNSALLDWVQAAIKESEQKRYSVAHIFDMEMPLPQHLVQDCLVGVKGGMLNNEGQHLKWHNRIGLLIR